MEPAAILRILVETQGLRETQLQLAELNRQAKRTGDSTGGMEKQFSRLNSTASKTGGVLAAVAVGAADVGSAMVPLVGAGAGVVGLFSALGQGAVVAKLAFDGIGKALSGNKKALQELTPAQRTFVGQLKSMKEQLGGVQQIAAAGLLPGVAKGLQLVVPLIDRLKPVFAATAVELGKLATQAGRMVASMGPAFQRIGQTNVRVLGNLGGAAIAFGQALIRLVDAARPFTLWMSRIIKQGAQWIDSQVKAGQATGKLRHFLEQTKEMMKLVGRTLGDLLGAFGQVAKSMAPFGKILLQLVDDVARLVRHNPQLAHAVGIFLNLGAAAKIVSLLISPVGKVAKAVGSLADTLVHIRKAVAIAKLALSGLTTFLASNPWTLPLVALGIAIGIALTHWKQFKRGVEIIWDRLKHDFASGVATLLGFISTFLHGLGSLLDAISHVPGLSWVKGLADDVNHAGDSIDRLRNKLMGVGEQNKKTAETVSTAWGGAKQNLQRAITDMLHSYGDFHDKVGTTNTSLRKNFDIAYGLIEHYIKTHAGRAKAEGEAALKQLNLAFGRYMNASSHTTDTTTTSMMNHIIDRLSRAGTSAAKSLQGVADHTKRSMGSANTTTDRTTQTMLNHITDRLARAATNAANSLQKVADHTKSSMTTSQTTTDSHTGRMLSLITTRTSNMAKTAAHQLGLFAGHIRDGMQHGDNAVVQGGNAMQGAVKKLLGTFGNNNVSLAKVAAVKIAGYARGGMVDQPTYMVGEEAPRHPEVVVATNPAYRAQNVKYWAQAGKMLGVPGFEKGGIPGFKTGGYAYPYPAGTGLGRTDQGVDTGVPAGGLFRAMGDAIIGATNIGGWPGGPLMNWQLTSGPARGRWVYLAEMIRPLVHSGQHVSGSTAVAASTGPSQEMGWWTGGPYGETLARATGGYSEGQVTAAGSSFRSFIGGGKVGPALAAIASIIAPHVTGGGRIGQAAQAALSKIAAAANAFVQAHAPVMMGATGTIGAIPASTGNVERDIYKTLSARGWNKVAVAAAIGNAFQESGLNPAIEVSGNGGLFGFTSGAVSLSAVKSAAASKGVPWTSAAFQAAFMAAHYGDLHTLNAYRDPRQAALYFMNTFEHPYAPKANIPNREAAAARAYAQGYAQGGFIPPFAGSFAGGGIVPGPLGAARTAIVHGGESISNNSGPLIAIENLNVHDDFDERALAHRLAFLIET